MRRAGHGDLPSRPPARRHLRVSLIALASVLSMMMPAARAGAAVVAVEPYEAATPVLWSGGVAWWSSEGVRAALPGSPPRLLARFPEGGGLSYQHALDSGSGAGASSGALAYGWEEANNMVPPMGPGDQNVPSPAIPYETSISRRGVIGADGSVSKLPGCGVEAAYSLPSFGVSLAGQTVAYGCNDTAPGAPSGVGNLALGALGALGTTASTIVGVEGPFQLSGNFIVYAVGEPSGAGKLVVKNLATNAVAYEVPSAAKEGPHSYALQEDGTLVVLGAGTSACAEKSALASPNQAYPAAWFSVAEPVAHQLGCFYAQGLRPVGGQWIALQPGPGLEASLVLVSLATGLARTLAVFPNATMFRAFASEESSLGLATLFGGDFDGHRLTWLSATCGGTAVQFAADVSTMSPGPAPSSRCPVRFDVHAPLRPGARGALRVRVSCPLGCEIADLAIAKPRALAVEGPSFFSLPASGSATKAFHLSRHQLSYLRRHRRVKITLTAEASSLGGFDTKSAAQAVLTR